MRPKLATLSLLESIAGLARRLGLGRSRRQAGAAGRRGPFERFELDVDGVRLAGTELAQLALRARAAGAGARADVRAAARGGRCHRGGVVLEGGAHLGFVTVHAARAVGPERPRGRLRAEPDRARRPAREPERERRRRPGRGRAEGARRRRRPDALLRQRRRRDEQPLRRRPVESEPVEVEVVRADDDRSGPVDVVKLDIEGGELAALRGMEGLLGGDRPPRAALPRVQS